MPPRSKRTVRQRTSYTYWHGLQLCGVPDFFNEGFGRDATREALQSGWQDLGEELTAYYTERFPGHRPRAWWMFEAPERRRRMDGKAHPYDVDVELAAVAESLMSDYGLPGFGLEGEWGGIEDLIPFESQPGYLARLKLLTPVEKKALGTAYPRTICPLAYRGNDDVKPSIAEMQAFFGGEA